MTIEEVNIVPGYQPIIWKAKDDKKNVTNQTPTDPKVIYKMISDGKSEKEIISKL